MHDEWLQRQEGKEETKSEQQQSRYYELLAEDWMQDEEEEEEEEDEFLGTPTEKWRRYSKKAANHVIPRVRFQKKKILGCFSFFHGDIKKSYGDTI
mgnify:CR=1 FL=1